MKKNTTEKRLFKYALNFKRPIIIGLICLIISVALELTGPFIAKHLIDNHIVGVANHYVESDEAERSVEFEGSYYVRKDRSSTDASSEVAVTLFQSGITFYLFENEVPLNASIVEEDGDTFTLHLGEEIYETTGKQLSVNEVFAFFSPEIQPIVWLIVLFLGLILISSFFLYYETYLLQYASNRIIQKMRDDVFHHIQQLPVPYFVKNPAGTILARVTNDTEAIRELYVRVLSVFASGIVYMVGIFIALMLLDAKLALICMLLIPIMYVWMKVYKKVGGKYNKVIRETNSKINGNLNESIQGMNIIQAFNQTERMNTEFEELNEKHRVYQTKMNTFTALTSFNLVNVVRNLAFVTFILYFGGAALDGSTIVTAGVLYAFVDLLTRLFQPVNQVISQLALLEQARVAGSRVFELMDEQVEEVSFDPIPRYDGEVEFDNVSFAYEKDEFVLNNISFHVKAGETAAFVGHTGSGKSTIMNLLFRFYDPTYGSIKIDGKNTKDLAKQQVRSHIGIVLQDPFIFTGTIISNITMNDPSISREQAIAALKAVGADRFIEKLPNKYDEPVKEKGNEFSTGERQLLSFARALAFDPAILILDEATANIDTETEAMIQKALNVLKKGRTTLIIAHRLSTIQQADQIFVLKHGKMIENGNHDSLLTQKGEYYKMYEMQLGKQSIRIS